MTEKDAEKKETEKQGDGKFHMGDLRELIRSEVTAIVDAGKKVTSTDTKAHDEAEKVTEARLDSKSAIASEVEAAIAEIRSKEEREARNKDIDEKLNDLFKRTEERPPVERRRVHRLMGWGE